MIPVLHVRLSSFPLQATGLRKDWTKIKTDSLTSYFFRIWYNSIMRSWLLQGKVCKHCTLCQNMMMIFFQMDMHLIRIESCKFIFLQQLTAGCMASACMAGCMAKRAMASFLLRPWSHDLGSTRTLLVTLLRPWIRRFGISFSAWWLRTSRKFNGQEFEEIHRNIGSLEASI